MSLTMGSAFGFSGVDWGASLIDRDWAKSDAAKQAQANERGAERAMEFSSAEAAANRDWQKDMSSTAWQRAVTDMGQAGLNPMLAYSQGGASTPGGGQGMSSAATGSATRGTPLSGLTGATTAAQVDNINAQTDNIKADTANKEADNPNIRGQQGIQQQTMLKLRSEIEKILQDKDLSEQQTRKVFEEVKNAISENRRIEATTGNIKVDTLLKELDVPKARNEAEAEGTAWKKNVAPFLNDAGRVTNSASDVARTIRGRR